MPLLKSTSHYSVTDNENLEIKPYLCLGLVANLEDLITSVDSISSIFRIFDPCSPLSTSRYGIALGALDGYLLKLTLFNLYVFRTP